MFNWLFGKQINYTDEAMKVFQHAYMEDVYKGYSVEVAEVTAKAAADAYLNYYHSLKDQGL